MTMTRRTLMKGIALAPAFSLADSPCASSQALPHGTSTHHCSVNILLHGLFFMEFKPESNPDRLQVTALDYAGHTFGLRNRGIFTEFPPGTSLHMDLGKTSLTGLLPGTIKSFQNYPAIPQFSKSETKVGDLVENNYRLSIELPLPYEIVPLRLGQLSDFGAAAESGRVKDSIIRNCGKSDNKRLALITCFRYLRASPNACPPPATQSFYAEAIHTLPSDINQAYIAASQLFADPQNFDLRVNHLPPSVKPDSHPGFGISPDDEMSLAETQIMPILPFYTNVGSCIQFGVGP